MLLRCLFCEIREQISPFSIFSETSLLITLNALISVRNWSISWSTHLWKAYSMDFQNNILTQFWKFATSNWFCTGGLCTQNVMLLYHLLRTSDWLAPRSVSSVVIWVRWSTDRGCFNNDIICIFKFFLTLLTWDLDRVGGKFTVKHPTWLVN